MRYEVTVAATRIGVETDALGRFVVDDEAVAADVRSASRDLWLVTIDGASHEVALLSREPLRLLIDGREVRASVADERELAAARAGGATRASRQEIRAPMPGLVKAVHVREGDAVERGTPLVTLEAMKMENEIAALDAGRVVRLTAAAGTKVEGGAVLVVIGPAA